MIEFHCSNCGKSLKAKEEHAGRVCKCTGCQQENTIPVAVQVVAEGKAVLEAKKLLQSLRYIIAAAFVAALAYSLYSFIRSDTIGQVVNYGFSAMISIGVLLLLKRK